MNDPIRLSDDPTFSPEVSELLRHRGEVPPAMDPAVHAATCNAITQLGAAQAAGTVVGAKLVIVSVVIGVGVALGAASVIGSAPTVSEVPEAHPIHREAAPASPAPDPHRDEVPVVTAAPGELEEAEVVTEPEAVAAQAPTPSKRSARPRSDVDRLTLEAALLERARAALAGDPRDALAAANRHAREYPRGQLTSARELIAIDALRRLRRTRQAARRAESLIARDPSGIHADRARAMLAELSSE